MIHNCNQGKADDAMKEKSMVNEVTKGMADAAHAAVLQRQSSQQLTPLTDNVWDNVWNGQQGAKH